MRLGRVFLAIAIAAVIGLVSVSSSGPATSSAEGARSTHLGAVLVGGNEVPAPGDPDGFGLADVWISKGEVCWRITVNGVEPIAAAHIHAGPVGVAGPVVVPLEPYSKGCTDTARRTARFIREHPQEFYVNVHNAAYPGGALRGQLRR